MPPVVPRTEWLPSRNTTRPPSLDRLATMPAMTALFSRIIPILFVSDLAAERDFYIRLGFHVTYEGPEYPDFASLGHGSVEFGIERRDGFRSGAPDHVLTWQFGISDIDLARKRLAEAGVPFREEVMAPAPDWQYRVLHARTPNGYHLLLEEGSD